MKNVLIFGDSYSTFQGFNPDGYEIYYPTCSTDVKSVEQTWWARFIKNTNGKLLQNNSWSGSTIGYTGYNSTDCSKSSSFIYRYRQLREEGYFKNNKIDTVFVFGGTNDSWADAPLGEMQFLNWEEKDLYFVLPAICYFMSTLKKELPNAGIYFLINTELKPAIGTCIKEAGKYYNVDTIELKNVEKVDAHPNCAGMKSISEQVLAKYLQKLNM